MDVADFLYRHSVTIDNVNTEVEILDTSRCEVSSNAQLFIFAHYLYICILYCETLKILPTIMIVYKFHFRMLAY